MGNQLIGLSNNVLQKVMCRFGRHHRDGSIVRRVDKRWRSVCTGCGASMIKIDETWMLRSDFLAEEELAANADYSEL